ncbi:MAG: tetratricopeptide repeat protein [Nitrospirota bacterium]
MSLLADLLSKVKYKSASVGEGRKTDVPPDLKRVVSSSAEKEATKKRILILSVLVLLAIVAGVGAVYLMELYIKPSAKKRIAKTTAPTQIETRPALPEVESPKPQAPATKPKPSETKPKAAKPKPAKEIPKQKPEQKKTPEPKIEEKKIAEEQRPEPKAEPKAENFQKDAEKKPAIAQEPQPKPQDSQKDVYLYTARTYESKKDYHQALLNYKKAIEIDPGNYIIMNNISSVLIHLGSFEESIKYAKNVLAIKKDYVPSLINIGIAYIRLNNPAEGEAYLSKALSIEPSNSYALLNLGLLYEKRGDNDKAYGYFSKLSEMGNIQGHLGIARIAEKQGKSSDAVRIYREILSMNNIDPKTRKLVNDRLLQLQ